MLGMLKKEKQQKEYTLLYNLRKNRSLYLMLLPVLVGFTIFQFIPIVNNFLIGFVKYDIVNGMWASKFVGFKYFIMFFKDPFFLRLVRNTLLIGVYHLVWGFPAPIILALLLNEVRSNVFKRVTQSVTYLPHFISTIVVVGIMYTVFGAQGVVNSVVVNFGADPIQFVGNPSWFRTLYIGSGIWQQVGWESIIYIAAIAGVNPELYESAVIDGANRWHKARYITFPGIAPAVTILLILNVGKIVSVGFEKIYLMYSPVTYAVADVISTYVYRRGIQGLDFSYAGAVQFFNSAISLILIMTANYFSKKVSETSLF